VVSDAPGAADAVPGSDEVSHYGGHLIAESVAPSLVPLIAAAPEMYKALKDAAWLYDQMAMGPLEAAAKYGDNYEPPSDDQCLGIRAAIHAALTKAEGAQ
jgi:hypothetical protein